MRRFRYRISRAGFAVILSMLSTTGPALCQSAPEKPADSLSTAKESLRRGEWQAADELLRAYLVEHQTSAEAHALLGLALFRENHPKESLAEFTHSAQIETPTALDLRWVALDYVLLGAYSDADRWMTKSVGWNPRDGEAWYSLGRIKYQENRFAEAEEAFKKALALMPLSVKSENNLGLVYEGLNRRDDAVAAYHQAMTWQSATPEKSEQPYLNLGILLLNEGNLIEAETLLQEADALSPRDLRTVTSLGQLYSRQGNLPKAQSEFEQATALDPKTASTHFQLGQVYRKEGLSKQAAEQFALASQLDGTHSSNAQ